MKKVDGDTRGMAKLDMKKTLSTCYTAAKDPRLIDVPAVRYLCYQGAGDPNTSTDFRDGIGVLYGLAYTIKFAVKETGRDFTVMPLEAQWWSDDPEERFTGEKKDTWKWKVMIAVPDFVDDRMFEDAQRTLRKKKNAPGLDRANVEEITDGISAQILYIGPYSDEGPSIKALHRWIGEQGYRLRGHHREIYLSDPNKTAPEKLKTIIRHPVEKADG